MVEIRQKPRFLSKNMSWPISRHSTREFVVAILLWDFSNKKFYIIIKTKKMDQYLTIRGERKEVESNLDIRCLPEHCTNKIKLRSVDLWCLRVGTTASISQLSSGVASWCSSIRIIIIIIIIYYTLQKLHLKLNNHTTFNKINIL